MRFPSPDELATISVERSRVIAGLAQLHPPAGEVLVLAYFDGHSQTEIAQQTGLPLGTVNSRTRSGLN